MMDELERFIAANREEIGKIQPSPQNWAKLEKRLAPPTEVRMVPLRRVWQVAAAVALILTSFFAWKLSNLQPQPQIQVSIDWRSLAPELASAEQYYVQQIHQKLSEVKQYAPEKYGIDPKALETEIAQLDSVYQQMGKDLIESQSDQRVVGAMIENLQIRIEILNRQLQILEQLQKVQKVEEIIETEI
jgi:septal ring factor EnvC (AmiA/AmiB activator)